VSDLGIGDFLSYLNWGVRRTEKITVMHVNVYGLNLAYENIELRHAYSTADLIFFDGFGALWGARILGFPVSNRITGADWIWSLSESCSKNTISMFFLGAGIGISERAAHCLLKRFPNLNIAWHHGYFDRSKGSRDNIEVIEKINQFKPDILIVGMGMPDQEIWLSKNRQDINAAVAITAGAVFDYLAGNLRRAPDWMNRSGLEWLGRLIIEPHRLWRRYLLGNPIFLWRLLLVRLGIRRFPIENSEMT
jgi:N-acetylglucosaminyldiphosphoundecaprenol N-acetyl-beta-D-mannosaminyltransferase